MMARGKAGISVVGMYAFPVIVWGLLLAIGYWPTRFFADAEGIRAMLAAQGLVVLIVYLTMVPLLWRMAGNDGAGRFQRAMWSALVRYLGTLSLAGLILWRGVFETKVFLIWLAISYLIMLNVETLILVRGIKRLCVLPQTRESYPFGRPGNGLRVSVPPQDSPGRSPDIHPVSPPRKGLEDGARGSESDRP